MVSGKLSKWLGGGFLAGFLVALAVLVMAASTPSGFTPWSAFVGTNRIIIRTNAAGNLVQVDGQAIIDSSNSLVSQISAAQVWTNAAGVIMPVITNAQLSFNTVSPESSWCVEYLISATTNSPDAIQGFRIRVLDGGHIASPGNGGFALDIANDSHGGGGQAVFDGTANYGIDSTCDYFTNGIAVGEGDGVSGTGQSAFSLQYGVTGLSVPYFNSQTNIGVSGTAMLGQENGVTTGVFVGVVGALSPRYYNGQSNLTYESTALLLDNRTTGFPLLIARTNNGEMKVFEVDGTKTTNATPLDVAGLTTLYGGLQVKNSATLDGGVTIGPSTASLFLGTNWQWISDSLVPNHDLRLIDNWNLSTPLLVGTNGILTLSNGLSLPTGAGAAKVWTSVDSSGAGSWSNAVGAVSGVAPGTGITTSTNAGVVTVSASGLSGSTNWIRFSPQAGKLPATNYPGVELGQQNWGLVFSKTNAEGSIASLSATWQDRMFNDYATNTLLVRITSMLLSTNGPNTSNTIFRCSFARATSGDSTDIHTMSFGTAVSGTNTWTQSTSNTNKEQSLVIAMTPNDLVGPGDLFILKVDRDAVNDTFGGAVSLINLQLQYTRP